MHGGSAMARLEESCGTCKAVDETSDETEANAQNDDLDLEFPRPRLGTFRPRPRRRQRASLLL